MGISTDGRFTPQVAEDFMAEDDQPLPHDDLVTALRRAHMPVIEADLITQLEALRIRAENGETDASAYAEMAEVATARAETAEKDAAAAHEYADEVERSFDTYRAQAEASIERLATALRRVSVGPFHAGERFIADESLATLARERMIAAALRDVLRYQSRPTTPVPGTRAALAREG
jgi:hypothetical protein